MSVARALGLLAMFLSLALLVVHVRGERQRCETKIVRMELRKGELRRAMWDLQSRAARLRSPRRIVESTQTLLAGVMEPPLETQPASGPKERVARREP